MSSRKGMTLLEIMIAMAILAVIIVISLSSLVTVQTTTINNTDKSFAVQKAISILSELRGVVESTSGASAALLDGYDDGIGQNPMLTISPTAVNPDDPVSGNFQSSGVWTFNRRITVRRFTSLDARDVRLVTVRVFRATPTNPTETLLADITSVIRTVGDIYPPTQVYDLYVLAIENVPGWWVYMANLKPFIENSLADLQARNPGLTFRLHWITKLGYGRDMDYKPYVNKAPNDSNAAIPSVYFYPGTMPGGSAVSEYYVPDLMTGQHSLNGTFTNVYDPTANPWPYSYADMWNNCMRYPDALDYYNARLAAGQETAEEPPLQILLEQMNRNPDAYRNVIFMNLHGELIPFPPLRNYSDAAKAPDLYPQWRAVAHPESLRAPAAGGNVRFRIYAYLDEPGAVADNLMEVGGSDVPIVFRIRDADLTQPGDVDVHAVEGGFDQDGILGTDNYVNTFPALTVPTANRQYYTVSTYVDAAGFRWTEWRFFNTPLRCPPRVNTGTTPDSITGGLGTGNLPDGTAADWRLYGRDYIPCATEAANNFTINLSSAGNRPKNTARWWMRINVPAELPGGQTPVVAETRIGLAGGGVDLTHGSYFPARIMPQNLSRTYCWRTDDVNDVPFTERYQITGDPRHCPYADLKDTPSPAGAPQSFTNGYNWFFDNFQRTDTSAGNNFLGAGEWEGWSAARLNNGAAAGQFDFDGWNATTSNVGDAYELDVPRLFQLLRRGLTESGAIWTTLTGFSYYYLGVGGEIGYDSANGFPSSIPTSGRPFNGTTASRFEDSITTAMTGGVKYIREWTGGTFWWGAHWIGELCPDTAYGTQWRPNGNLNSPTSAALAAGRFTRIRRQDIPVNSRLPRGTSWTNISWVRRTNTRGCTSFFGVGTPTNSATPTALFRHNFNSGQDGNITSPSPAPGIQLAEDFNFSLPTTTKISRPFRTNFAQAWGFPEEFAFFTPDYPRYGASVWGRFYGHQADATFEGCSIVHLNDPTATKRAFIVISGLDTTTESGSAFIAKMSTLSLIYAYLDSGRASASPGLRVTELPRLTLDFPTNVTELLDPVTITLQWNITWRRWDNNLYTRNYLPTYTETESDLRYACMYSVDNGASWRFMDDNTPATLGKVPLGKTTPDAAAGTETFAWDVSSPASFPEGSYLIRVECYRGSNPTNHYSTHQQKIFIDR